MSNFTIQVSGEVGTGKSVLMYLIKKALQAVGFNNIKVKGMDEQCENFDKRIPALQEKDAALLAAKIDLVEFSTHKPILELDPLRKNGARYVLTHEVPGEDSSLQIYASDLPSFGGDNHRYEIQGFNTQSNPSEYSGSLHHQTSIIFQNGKPEVVGINGITMESLIAICTDRLMHLQAGPYPCSENQEALVHLVMALDALKYRTQKQLSAKNSSGGC